MATPVNLLLVEDNPHDAELLVRELRRTGFAVRHRLVDTEPAFLAALTPDLDLVISDFAMPQFNGLRALELLKARGLDIPFILVSGTIGEDTAVAAMKHGAADYLLKDRLTRLGAAVTRALADLEARRQRRRAEDAMRANELQFRELTEHIQDVFWSASADCQQLHYVSPAYEKIWGRSVASLRADPAQWLQAIVPTDRPRVVAALAALGTGGSYEVEFRIERPDRTQRWILDRGYPVRDAAGRVLRLVGAARDVTEHKHAEEIVRQASSHVTQDRRKRIRLELAILAGAAAAVFLLASHFQWYERFVSWTLKYEAVQLDDIALTAVFLAVGLAVFAFRRWRESESELIGRQHRQSALGLLHDELDRRIADRTHDLENANRSLRTEVAERQRAEVALRVSEERFRSYFDLGLIGLAITSPEKGYLEVNRELCQILGYKKEEFLKKTWAEMTHPDDVAADATQFARVVAGEHDGYTLEKRFVRRDGGIVHTAMATRCARRPDGTVNYFVTLVQDITARKEAEEARHRAEARYHSIFEHAVDGIYQSTPAGRYVTANPAMARILGYDSPDELIRNIADIASEVYVKPAQRADFQRQLQEHGVVSGFEAQMYRRDRSVIWTSANARVSRDEHGPVLYEGIMEDITERKKLEHQFLHAQRMEAIGMLASGVAHDLNNILTPMLMVAGILKEGTATDKEREMLTMIERSGQRGAAIIRQLLAFSRGLSGEKVVVQPHHLISDMVEIMRETFPRNLTIIEHVPTDVWTVAADPTQLHQVIMNLCVNARDAMPVGGTLTLKAANTVVTAAAPVDPALPPGPYLLLTVADTGHGIPPGIVGRIFEPFFTTKEVGKGTGLGLSTVAGIIKNHGGAVKVSSEPGAGTVFRVYLPAADARPGTAPTVPAGESLKGHGELILVVDDEAPIREAVRGLLEASGYRVALAQSGEEALMTVIQQQGSLQLVLTDMMMPGMDGLSLIRALRIVEPGLSVIANSGLAQDYNRDELAALGVTTMLSKPYLPANLLAAIQATLAR